jgi:branched-chain amino acid aminotransferase
MNGISGGEHFKPQNAIFRCYNSTMYVYLNGKLVPSKEASVSVFDHGFLYGDGIYETMRVYEGVIFKLDEHIKRLYRSASLIGLTIPLEIDALKISIYETLIANNLSDAYLRLTVSRGRGLIGLDPELCLKPTVVIIAQKFKGYPKTLYQNGISMIVSRTRRNLKEAINPQIKSLNFLNNILAKIEAKRAGAYEAIMLNAKGELTEGTVSNVFFYKNDILCTPSIECGILDGITRRTIIDIAIREELKVKEGKFTKKDIYSAEEVFITNTTLEVMPVSKIDKSQYNVGNVAKFLHKVYRQEVNAYVANLKAEEPSIWGSNI